MPLWTRLYLILVPLFLVAGCSSYDYVGTVLDPPNELESFTLDTGEGTLALGDLEGKYTLLFFGYTFCPDICPATLFEMKQVIEVLGPQAEQVQVVFVSVDPARDSPEQLAAYVSNFDPNFIGATAIDGDDLDMVLAQFGATYFIEEGENPNGGYLVTHTGSIFVIDPDLRWRALFRESMTAEEISRDLRQLMRDF
ncbi:MAG: SCO family protein [Chloroflexi bacterium]|nr:SCO family protein [Chloroflexota bacterium]